MNVEVQPDPFAPFALPPPPPALPAQELEAAWFDAPAICAARAHSSRPPFPCAPSQPPPPIDDPVADPWFK